MTALKRDENRRCCVATGDGQVRMVVTGNTSETE